MASCNRLDSISLPSESRSAASPASKMEEGNSKTEEVPTKTEELPVKTEELATKYEELLLILGELKSKFGELGIEIRVGSPKTSSGVRCWAILEKSPECSVVTTSLPLDEIEGSEIIQLPWLPPRMQPSSHLHVGAFGHVRLVCFRIVLGIEIGSHTNLLTFRQQ